MRQSIITVKSKGAGVLPGFHGEDVGGPERRRCRQLTNGEPLMHCPQLLRTGRRTTRLIETTWRDGRNGWR